MLLIRCLINMNDKSHAPLGGSSADRWSNCTASYYLCQEVPKEESSEASIEGTRIHKELEICLKDFLSHKTLGTPYPPVFPIDNIAFEIVDVIWEKVLLESITGKVAYIEQKVTLNENMWGTADFIVFYIDDKGKKVCTIFDYKNGRTEVTADKNAQLAFYALGAEDLRGLIADTPDLYRGVIYQPNCSSGITYKEAKITTLDTWKKKFFKAHDDIFSHKVTYKVGKWCNHCPAKPICKKYNAHVASRTSLKIIDDPLEVYHPKPEHLDDETLKNLVLYADEMKSLINSYVQYAYRRHAAGNPIEGLKFIETKGRRKVPEEPESLIAALTNIGCQDIYNLKLKGIGALEAELSKFMPKKEAKKFLDQYLIQGVGSLKLVPKEFEAPEVKSVDLSEIPNVDELE